MLFRGGDLSVNSKVKEYKQTVLNIWTMTDDIGKFLCRDLMPMIAWGVQGSVRDFDFQLLVNTVTLQTTTYLIITCLLYTSRCV